MFQDISKKKWIVKVSTKSPKVRKSALDFQVFRKKPTAGFLTIPLMLQ